MPFKTFLFLIVLLFTTQVHGILFAQGPDTLWTRTYGGPADDEARCVVLCGDSGYALAGTTASWGNGGLDMYLFRVGLNGDTLWTRAYGGPEDDEGHALVKTFDGGFAIAGSTRSFGSGVSDLYLVRTDALGNIMWQRSYGGVEDEQALDVLELADHGFILAGSTHSFGAGYLDVYAVRTDSAGDTVWTRTFGGSDNDYACSLARNSNGDFLALGTTNSFGAGQGDLFLVRFNALGESLSARAYGGVTDNRGYCVYPTSDGGCVISGTSYFSLLDYEFLLVKMDSLYNEEWVECNGSLNADCAYAVRPARNFGYVYTGNFSFELYLVRTDTMGYNYWAQFYGGDYTDCAYSVQVTPDGGYVIAGVTNSFGAGANDAYVIKIGPDPTGMAELEEMVIGYSILSVYPSPSSGSILIEFQIPNIKYQMNAQSQMSLKIFDAAGRLVKHFNHSTIKPLNQVTWSGTDEMGKKVPAGIYFVQLEGGFLRETRKVILLR